jgi:hypothetical protein
MMTRKNPIGSPPPRIGRKARRRISTMENLPPYLIPALSLAALFIIALFFTHYDDTES